MKPSNDDNSRLMAGELPDDPEADAETIAVAAPEPPRWTAAAVDASDETEEEAEADDTEAVSGGHSGRAAGADERPLEGRGFGFAKLSADDPRLAVPQPHLTTWRRSYLLAGIGVLGVALAAGVTFAMSRTQLRAKRGDRLDMYSHPGGDGVPDAIAKLTTLQPRSAPEHDPREDEIEPPPSAPAERLRPDDYEQEGAVDERYEPMAAESDYRADTAKSGARAGGEFEDESSLPPMAMKEAKTSLTDGRAGALGGPGPHGLDLAAGSQPLEHGGGSGGSQRLQRDGLPPAMDDDERKERFMTRGALPELDAPLRDRALCELNAGTAIAANLETAINTDLPAQGILKATVTKAVLCGPSHEYVAIPQGATFSGSSDSRVAYGQDRVLFCWHRLYLPQSQRHPLGVKKDIGCVPGADITGESGLEGEVDNHWASVIGGVAISTFLSLGPSVAAGSQTGYAPTLGQQVAHGVSQNIAEAGDRILQRELLRKPTVKLQPQSFALILNADMILEPYEAPR